MVKASFNLDETLEDLFAPYCKTYIDMEILAAEFYFEASLEEIGWAAVTPSSSTKVPFCPIYVC